MRVVCVKRVRLYLSYSVYANISNMASGWVVEEEEEEVRGEER